MQIRMKMNQTSFFLHGNYSEHITRKQQKRRSCTNLSKNLSAHEW